MCRERAVAQYKRATKVCGSHTHKVPQITGQKIEHSTREHCGTAVTKNHRSERQVQDKNTTIHMPLWILPCSRSISPLDLPLHQNKSLATMQTKPRRSIGRPDNVSSPHELMKCTHTSRSPRVTNKWKKETTSLSGKPHRNTPRK